MSDPREIATTPVEGQVAPNLFQESSSFLDDVKTRFEGSQPDVYAAFIKALGSFYAATKQETGDADGNLVQLHETVKVLLHGHQDLMDRFESTLPRDYLNRQRDVPEHQR